MRTKSGKSIKSLGEAIQELTQELGIEKRLREYEAITRWEECVGSRIAMEATPTRITKGILTVRVRTSVWRNELMLRKKEIVEKINSTLGSSIVKDIRFQ